MNCTTCRYELSQCLDGRLPSGRRAVVMRHVETCESCAGFWAELQAAQALTMRLRSSPVGAGFREQLWQRIHAGEGTPEAALHDAVPIWTKVRYTLSGAAAAALLLATLTMLDKDGASTGSGAGNDLRAQTPDRSPEARRGVAGVGVAAADADQDAPSTGGLQARRHATPPQAMRLDAPPPSFHSASSQFGSSQTAGGTLASNPLLSSANRLSFQLVAVETARQLEQRHAEVGSALRMLRRSDNHDDNQDTVAIHRAIESARDFQAFGELLLDLHARERLVFTDTAVDADLRYAVQMLSHADQLHDPSLHTVESIVAPALRSERLAHVSRRIAMVPLDPHEELEGLLRLNTQRPEIFPKLFFVLPRAVDDSTFYMEGVCGPSWVAPRSEVEAHGTLLRIIRSQFGDADVQIHIDVSSSEREDD